jgi:hypothetical protein
MTARLCSVESCGKAARSGGMCNRHYEHNRQHGTPVSARRYTPPGVPALRPDGYLRIKVDGKRRLEHLVIAEKALGRPLPPGVEVHHVDKDGANNAGSNLVICTAAYHKLLHQRMRAQEACGNPNWRKCMYCNTFDDPANLLARGLSMAHRDCYNEYQRDRRAARAANKE